MNNLIHNQSLRYTKYLGSWILLSLRSRTCTGTQVNSRNTTWLSQDCAVLNFGQQFFAKKSHKFSTPKLNENSLAWNYLGFFMKRPSPFTDFCPIALKSNVQPQWTLPLIHGSTPWFVLCALLGLTLCISVPNPPHHLKHPINLYLYCSL